jgi:hypothetical protein
LLSDRHSNDYFPAKQELVGAEAARRRRARRWDEFRRQGSRSSTYATSPADRRGFFHPAARARKSTRA